MDLQWSFNNQNIKRTKSNNAEQIVYEGLGFIGLWGVFYQPFANVKISFGEFSIDICQIIRINNKVMGNL